MNRNDAATIPSGLSRFGFFRLRITNSSSSWEASLSYMDKKRQGDGDRIIFGETTN